MVLLTERLRSLWPVAVMDVLALALDAVVTAAGTERGLLRVALSDVPLFLAVVAVPVAVGWRHGAREGRVDAGRQATWVAAVSFLVYVIYLALGAAVGEPVVDFWMLVFWPVGLFVFGIIFVVLLVPPWLGIVLGAWWQRRSG